MTSIILKHTNEFCPDINSIGWVNFDGIMILKSNITYKIRKELCQYLYQVCGEDPNCKLVVNYEENIDIGIIYVVNNINGQSYIGYSTIPLILFLKYNVCSKILGRESVFDYFEHNGFINYSFKILEFVKYDSIDVLNKRKYFLEALYLDDENNSKQSKNLEKKYLSLSSDRLMDVDKFYAKRIKIFDIIYDRFKHLDYVYINIYKLTNNTNGRTYITGDTRKLSKIDVFNNLLKSEYENSLSKDLSNYSDYFDFTNLECCKVKSIIEYQIRLDYHLIKYNAVTKGYNNNYLLDESKLLFNNKFISSRKKKVIKNLFLKINMYLIDKNITDVGNYDNIYGILYKIERIKTKEKYFGVAYNKTLKEIIKDKYQFAIDNTIKHDKLLKTFMEFPYDNFKFDIILVKYKDDYAKDLEKYLIQYIRKYNTINEGYNIDRRKNNYIFG